MNVTEEIARFIVETDLRKMPPEVIALTKNAMIDTIGVGLAGATDPVGKAITAFVQKFECGPVARVIGSNVLTSSHLAALANGTIFHALEYDDVGGGTQGHPSAVLMPVIISLGEELGVSFKELVEAYVLGLEIWAKIASTMPMMRLKGWHPTGVLGTIGAAAAAAKLMKLSTGQTIAALGIAASEAAGLIHNLGTATKCLHAGNAARSGIMAASLAKDGFTAAEDILGKDGGFPATFYGKLTVYPSKMVEQLGNPFALISPGITVKKYPSCFGTHRVLDAILHLVNSFAFQAEEIRAVNCLVDPERYKILLYSNPRTRLEAKFSMQFAVATAIAARNFGLAQDNEELVKDSKIKSLMKRVTCSIHPDWVEGKDTSYTRPDMTEVRLYNGKAYSYEVLTAIGDPKIPLTQQQLLAKFRECAKLVLGKKEIESCIELVWGIEELKNVRELTNILVANS